MPPSGGFRPVICTVASQSHIGQFAVLLKSVFEHHETVAVCLLVIDADADKAKVIDGKLRGYLEAGDRCELTVITLEDAYGDAETAETLRFCYDAFELCNIARGGLHRWMLDRTSYDAWVYLDGDMVCFAPLDSLFDNFRANDLLVFAHWGAPSSAEDDLILLKYGPYNGGLLGVRRSESGERFVRWFFDRMLRFGRVDTRLPLSLQPDQRFAFFADQTWLTLVPIYFERTATLKERGLNCGPWNVGNDEFDFDGRLSIGGDRVTLLHLSGWSAAAPNVLCNYVPRDMSANAWWQQFIPTHCEELARTRALFHRPYKYAKYRDGTDITPYQRRAFLKLQMSGRRIAQSPFSSPNVVAWLAADFDTYDYAAPGLKAITVDRGFPGMIEANRHRLQDAHFRSDIPHKRYADIRNPQIAFLSRDEAMVLYNTALQFAGRSALEIGCWLGWSTCHLAAAGVALDVVDPMLADPSVRDGVATAIAALGNTASSVALFGDSSPAAVERLGHEGRRWNLVFIDGNHEAPAPLDDVAAAEKFAANDAIVLLHNLANPGVGAALDYLRDRGWETMVYATAQIMGVAWRGKAVPIRHIPDPRLPRSMPAWLNGYRVST